MMTKYISKDKAISIAVANCDKYHFADDAMLEIIEDIEKEVAAEDNNFTTVVRCKECRYRDYDGPYLLCQKRHLGGYGLVGPNDFCSHGREGDRVFLS